GASAGDRKTEDGSVWCGGGGRGATEAHARPAGNRIPAARLRAGRPQTSRRDAISGVSGKGTCRAVAAPRDHAETKPRILRRRRKPRRSVAPLDVIDHV